MNKQMTRRILVAGMLVGATLGSLPGRADTTLAVISTSVDDGFSSVNPIAARFNAGLDATASTARLVDKLGDPVTTVLRRVSSGSGPDYDSLVLTPNLSELQEKLSPYTVTFDAVAASTSTTPPTASVERTFWLDLKKGSAVITTPSNSGQMRVVAPGEEFSVSGYAYDDYAYDTVGGTLIPRTANRSGLGTVEIKLYKLNPGIRSMPGFNPGTTPTVNTEPPGLNWTPPSVTPPVIQPSQEVTSLRHSATLSPPTRTTGQVDGEKTWTANLTGVGQGSWTLQAVAIDKAGNRSAVAETSFVIL